VIRYVVVLEGVSTVLIGIDPALWALLSEPQPLNAAKSAATIPSLFMRRSRQPGHAS
jgi:hypothetical protein